MASDRKQFAGAHRKWSRLLEDGQFSEPPATSSTAIVTSRFTDEPLDTRTGLTELESFHREAHELVARQTTPTVLAIDASRSEITDLVRDRSVSSMIVIGNGSLSTLMLGQRDYFDWNSVASATDHLKLGQFIQRQCGGLTRDVNVPLGLFAIHDPRNLRAAVGNDAFFPTSLDDPVNCDIAQVFDETCVSYTDVKMLTKRHDSTQRCA